jgi:hypothetical protein
MYVQADLRAMDKITIRTRTCGFGVYDRSGDSMTKITGDGNDRLVLRGACNVWSRSRPARPWRSVPSGNDAGHPDAALKRQKRGDADDPAPPAAREYRPRITPA